MRKNIVAGNWKMNNDLSETQALLTALKNETNTGSAQVIVAPTFVNLSAALESLNDAAITVAAQNMHQAASGAFTGEISAGMLKGIGITTVILGHSERRAYFHESDELLAQKVDEPVWAIGTGETASPEQAQDMHAFIRKVVGEKYNATVADDVTILYGGSVKPTNAKEIFSKPDVDGGLIGGASLKAKDFFEIVNAF